MYQMLEGLAMLDWLSPLHTILLNLIRHPTHSFFIPYDCGCSGNDIIRLLRSRGVRSWGHLAVNGTFMFTVRRRHASLAQLILDQAGIPIRQGRIGPTTARRPCQRQQPKAPGIISQLEAWLDDLAGAL